MLPAPTEANRPAGGSDSPYTLRPQQASVPSSRIAQAWYAPALIDVNDPSGGEDSPSALKPQHSRAPPTRIPQV